MNGIINAVIQYDKENNSCIKVKIVNSTVLNKDTHTQNRRKLGYFQCISGYTCMYIMSYFSIYISLTCLSIVRQRHQKYLYL